MSIADNIFIENCKDILTNGTSTEGETIRAIWEDTNEPAHTIKKFGIVNRYDLRKEFPLMTLRRTAFKSAVNEVLWIYQKKSNNIHDLKSHIWDSWADETGSIGKAYGYQVGVKHKYSDGEYDQMDRVLKDLKETPYSRRIITNLYNHHDLHAMGLYPCCYSCTYNVTKEDGYDKPILNLVLNQRSNDFLAANNWNIVQYSALLMMVAQVSNMIPGEIIHIIADAHIYDRHIDSIKELISRTPFDAPTIRLDPDIKNFYDFTEDSFEITNYQYGEQIKNIPIAI